MTPASQVERIWVALALALAGWLSVGARVEQEQQANRVPLAQRLPSAHVARRKPHDHPCSTPPRRLRCVVRGRLPLLALRWLARPLPLVPHPWPQPIDAPQKLLPPAVRHGTRTPQEHARRRRGTPPAAPPSSSRSCVRPQKSLPGNQKPSPLARTDAIR
jgi:hypothetical protein